MVVKSGVTRISTALLCRLLKCIPQQCSWHCKTINLQAPPGICSAYLLAKWLPLYILIMYLLQVFLIQHILQADGQLITIGEVPASCNQLAFGDLLIHLPPWTQIAKDLVRKTKCEENNQLSDQLLKVSCCTYACVNHNIFWYASLDGEWSVVVNNNNSRSP